MKELPEWLESTAKFLNSRRITAIALLFSGLVSPGVLSLLFFKPELYFENPLPNLLIACAAANVPSIILCSALIFAAFDVNFGDEEQHKKCWMIGCGLSAGIWHLSLLNLIATNEAPQSFLGFIKFVAAVHLVVMVLFMAMGWIGIVRRRRARKQHSPGKLTLRWRDVPPPDLMA